MAKNRQLKFACDVDESLSYIINIMIVDDLMT